MKQATVKNLMTINSLRSEDLKEIAKSMGREEEYPLDLAIAMAENLESDLETLLYVLKHIKEGHE